MRFYTNKKADECLKMFGMPLEGVTVTWKWMKWDVLGKYYGLKPDTIYLNSRYSDVPNQMISTAIHELTHRKQRYRYGALYFLLAIPFIRNYTIEPEAKENELRCDNILQNQSD